jgi:hypothetical protein
VVTMGVTADVVEGMEEVAAAVVVMAEEAEF